MLPTAVYVLVVMFTKVIYWSLANINMQGSFCLHRADVTMDIYFQAVSDLETNGQILSGTCCDSSGCSVQS